MNYWLMAFIIIVVLIILYYMNDYYNKNYVSVPIDIDPDKISDMTDDIMERYNKSIDVLKNEAEQKRKSRNFIKEYFMSYNENIDYYEPDKFWEYVYDTINIGIDNYIKKHGVNINKLSRGGKYNMDNMDNESMNNIIDKVIINDKPLIYEYTHTYEDNDITILITYSGLENLINHDKESKENIDKSTYDSLREFIQITPDKIDHNMIMEYIAYICYEELQKQFSKDKKLHNLISYGSYKYSIDSSLHDEMKTAYSKVRQTIYNTIMNDMTLLFNREKLMEIIKEFQKKFNI